MTNPQLHPTSSGQDEQTNFTFWLSALLDAYDDYSECDEYHIHDGTNEHEGHTPPPHNFDRDMLEAAIIDKFAHHTQEAVSRELVGLMSQSFVPTPYDNRVVNTSDIEKRLAELAAQWSKEEGHISVSPHNIYGLAAPHPQQNTTGTEDR